jgi:hypothetical protein
MNQAGRWPTLAEGLLEAKARARSLMSLLARRIYLCSADPVPERRLNEAQLPSNVWNLGRSGPAYGVCLELG